MKADVVAAFLWFSGSLKTRPPFPLSTTPQGAMQYGTLSQV
nr:hypothetical protein [uncultured Kingella sp.]